MKLTSFALIELTNKELPKFANMRLDLFNKHSIFYIILCIYYHGFLSWTQKRDKGKETQLTTIPPFSVLARILKLGA